MLDSIEDYEWKETDKIYEQSFINMDGDLLYVEDTYSQGQNDRQTDFSDFQQDRYEVKIRRQYQPPETEDKTLHTSMDWDETQNFLNGITQ